MLCLAHETARKRAVRCLIQAVCCSIQEIEFFFIMGKKYNERGFSLINVKKDRGKLKKIYVKHGRPKLPKYLLDLEEVSEQEGTIIEAPRLKQLQRAEI